MKQRRNPEFKYSGIEPEEYRELINAAGLQAEEMSASFFGVDARIAKRWANGEKAIPVSVVMVLELMKHFQLSVDQIREITGEGYEE